ncbi:DUF6932 family protein [Paenibacillus pinistramenti]|uniref:DUF6932 family protein n=1 Tax=Paenibacillus pinistramenti TaxID=1768003 RepID=UPI0011083291|nr:hypothetical protein [Paenibacillus pinistramenti]
MIQQFLSNGNLTPGIHTYKLDEFKQQFVADFKTSSRRPIIYNNFTIWIEQLLNVLPPRFVWLDGSFLTTKVDPNDIDLVVFYYPEDIQNPEQANLIKELIQNESRKFNCDSYLCYSFEHWNSEQLAAISQRNLKIMQTYWMGQFGFDRSRNPKGMVQIEQQELQAFITGGVKR